MRKTDTSDYRSLLDFQIATVLDAIKSADTKAMWTFATVVGFAFFLINRQLSISLKYFSIALILMMVCCYSLLLLSATLAFWVILPRLRHSNTGILFFGDVAQYSSKEEFATIFLSRNQNSILIERAEQYYNISSLCRKKFTYLYKALWLGSIGIIEGISLLIASEIT